MSKADDESSHRQRVQQLLLSHLLAANAPQWPGGDGLTLDAVLRAYPQAAADGLVPDLLALQQRHPELADLLKDFFAA